MKTAEPESIFSGTSPLHHVPPFALAIAGGSKPPGRKRPLADIPISRAQWVVSFHRSPNFLLLVGGIALALSIFTWSLIGEGPLTWTLMLTAFPMFCETAVSDRAAFVGAMVYNKDKALIERLAYRPFGALIRCAYLFVFVIAVCVLGKGGFNLLAGNSWMITIIIVPTALYFAWAGAAYWNSIKTVAQQECWRTARNKRI